MHVHHAGHWGDIALDLALTDGSAQASAARLLAELNGALADSAIASWDAKYAYGLWRPITANAQAGADGNPLTTAQAAVLTDLLGPRASTTDSPALPGVNRSFPSFWAAAEEAGRSCIDGGIHFEFSNQDGQTLGEEIGQWALNSFQSPEHHDWLAHSNNSYFPAMRGDITPCDLV